MLENSFSRFEPCFAQGSCSIRLVGIVSEGFLVDIFCMKRVWFGFALLGIFLGGCSRDHSPAAKPVTREEVWQAIQPIAGRYRMDPAFIFALVAAESNFDPQARNGEARGLMQLKPAAWSTVSAEPYDPAVWDWRKNLEAGVDYLAWCRSYLHRRGKFSYPVLLASFHYGIDYVQERDFKLSRLQSPDNEIYRELWSGNLSPVPPPKT